MFKYFDIGDKVKITSGIYAGKVGVITEADWYDLLDADYIPEYKVAFNERAFGTPLNDNELELVEQATDVFTESVFDEDSAYLEMAAVGGGFDNIKLAVWGKEGLIPHFHFYKHVPANKGIPGKGHGGGCICFLKPNYFKHGTHKDTLNRDQMDDLIDFLRSKHESGVETVWQHMITLWNENNPESIRVPRNLAIPNYQYDMDTMRRNKE